jgi:hypothetical protein
VRSGNPHSWAVPLRNRCTAVSRELEQQRASVLAKRSVMYRMHARLECRVGRWMYDSDCVCKIRQSHGDLDLLLSQATAVNESFQDLIARIVGAMSNSRLSLVYGPVKKTDRVMQKLVRKYRRDTAAITDLIRCTLLVEALKDVPAVLPARCRWPPTPRPAA